MLDGVRHAVDDVEAAGDQHQPGRQQRRRVLRTRRQRFHARGRPRVGGRVVDLGARLDQVQRVLAADDQHLAVGQQRGRVVRTRDAHGRDGRPGVGDRIVDLGARVVDVALRGRRRYRRSAGDEHAAIGHQRRRVRRAHRGHRRGRTPGRAHRIEQVGRGRAPRRPISRHRPPAACRWRAASRCGLRHARWASAARQSRCWS